MPEAERACETAPGISLLGRLCVTAPTGVIRMGARQSAEFLSILAVHAGHVVSLPHLVECLWPERLGTPTSSLYVIASRARAALEQDPVWLHRLGRADGGYLLSVPRASIDVLWFQDIVARAVRQQDPTARFASLSLALDAARDPFLSGLESGWVQDFRAQFDQCVVDATVVWARAALGLGHVEVLVGELRSRIQQFPLAEALYEVLMEALVLQGRRAEALALFDAARRRLDDELGVLPGRPLRDVHARLLVD